uniref:Uncharacterized protein n=1 Tax=Kalanchoe fedtschenkoi TaxID=63787 RepID=A0A7N0UKI8_KALFE
MAVVLTWLIVMTLLTASSTTGVLGQGPLPGTNKALFIFGDSIYDAGNNIYEPANSHINYYPYGETYFSKPTGRVSDGRIIPDFVADYMKIPFIRPYSQPGFTNYTDGANFASSGASVLPENRPYATYLALQLKNFESVATKIENERGGKTANLLVSNAIYLISIGGNDYADLPSNTTSAARKRMVARVLATLSSALKQLHGRGARKFALQNVGPLGCMPLMKNRAGSSNGECVYGLTVSAKMHNIALATLLKQLQSSLSGFSYSLYDVYTALAERTRYPAKYGFKVGDSACCGSGSFNGQFTCGGKNGTVKYNHCSKPGEYVWFDGAHPTDVANRQLTDLFWAGSSTYVSPINLKALYEAI